MSDERQLSHDETRIDMILRSMSADELELDTPPDTVWAGIEAATVDAAPPPLAPVVELASRRRLPVLLGAVAAALVVIAGLAVVLVSGDSNAPIEVSGDSNAPIEVSGDSNAPIEVASAELVYSPDFDDLGIGRHVDVTLLEDGDTEQVRVDAADLPDATGEGDLEIWLIGLTGGEIEIVQTLGIVQDPTDPGAFVVPADFDRTAYDAVAVDISVEPHDGDPDHSGRSLVRGVLTA